MIIENLIISEQAIEDLKDIWLYIANDDLNIADKFIDSIYEKCKIFLEFPESGRNRDEITTGLKSLIVTNYIIFYRIKSNNIEIARILNGYRDIDSIF